MSVERMDERRFRTLLLTAVSTCWPDDVALPVESDLTIARHNRHYDVLTMPMRVTSGTTFPHQYHVRRIDRMDDPAMHEEIARIVRHVDCLTRSIRTADPVTEALVRCARDLTAPGSPARQAGIAYRSISIESTELKVDGRMTRIIRFDAIGPDHKPTVFQVKQDGWSTDPEADLARSIGSRAATQRRLLKVAETVRSSDAECMVESVTLAALRTCDEEIDTIVARALTDRTTTAHSPRYGRILLSWKTGVLHSHFEMDADTTWMHGRVVTRSKGVDTEEARKMRAGDLLALVGQRFLSDGASIRAIADCPHRDVLWIDVAFTTEPFGGSGPVSAMAA
jgi:hypothetical protein